MPNRIIKESIWTSPNLAKLSPRAELHFYRLLPVPDDYGCFESTASVIRGRCYPLNESIRSRDVQNWQDELEQNGLIIRWVIGLREYAIFTTWSKHQYIRPGQHQRITPEPPEEVKSRCSRDVTETYGELPKVTETRNVDNIYKETKYQVRDGVYLSTKETESLIKLFGEDGTNQRIEKLSLYMLSTGKKYKSHYHTILNWERRNDKENPAENKNNGHDPEKYHRGKYGHLVQR